MVSCSKIFITQWLKTVLYHWLQVNPTGLVTSAPWPSTPSASRKASRCGATRWTATWTSSRPDWTTSSGGIRRCVSLWELVKGVLEERDSLQDDSMTWLEWWRFWISWLWFSLSLYSLFFHALILSTFSFCLVSFSLSISFSICLSVCLSIYLSLLSFQRYISLPLPLSLSIYFSLSLFYEHNLQFQSENSNSGVTIVTYDRIMFIIQTTVHAISLFYSKNACRHCYNESNRP